MTRNPYIYILVMALVSYIVRVLPLTLIRRDINNRFIRSFLYYVPYVTLAVMTFPAILYGPASEFIAPALSTAAAAIAFVIAIILAWRGKSLLTVACVACGTVFIIELIPIISNLFA